MSGLAAPGGDFPLVIWLGVGLGAAVFALGMITMGRWIGRFTPAELILISLMAGLAFLVVSVPGFFLRSFTFVILGPFQFVLEGLLFKLLLFLVLGCLFVRVRRPGVFFLFYLLWMVAQALLNGHYSPMSLLFPGITITLIEGSLWLGGVTRPGGRREGSVALFAPALAVGLAEAIAVFWGLRLIQTLFRLYLADWYVLLQAGAEGLYAGVGMALGLALGNRLAPLRSPLLPEPVQDKEEPGKSSGRSSWPGPSSGPEAPSPGPLLEVGNLTYSYPGAVSPEPILRGLELRIAPGEIVLLAGDSGSGKSTLLRLLQGLLPWPAGATLRQEGARLPAPSPLRRPGWSGLLFQEPALQIVRPTVEGEVAFGAELQSGPEGREQALERAERAMGLFGLKKLARRSTATLSSGELQRTGLAAIMAQQPRLLLLDEPLAYLDGQGRAELLERLEELARAGVAIVIAEHRHQPLLRLARSVVWLERGSRAWQGSPEAFAPFYQLRKGPAAAQPPPRRRSLLPTGIAGGGHKSAAKAARPREGSARPRGAAAGAIVQLDGVDFSHGGSTAPEPLFRGLACRLPEGCAVALTGSNGAGKSTLFSLLLGLRRPQAGGVTLAGSPAHQLTWPQKARLCGYLPQQAELILQSPTVAGELGQALEWRGMDREAVQAAVGEWLEKLGLERDAGRCPHLLSKGERLRLALGAVMIAGPRLLLLDEPFAGQDAGQAGLLLALAADYLEQDHRRGLIAATHDLEPVERFFDLEWRLSDGGIVERPLGGTEPLPSLSSAGGMR